MASLEPGKYRGRRAPTGYTFRTSNSGRDTYTPVNELNRSNRYRRNPGSVGGGRSNLDNQRGFSNQGFGRPGNRQPGLFGNNSSSPMDNRSAAINKNYQYGNKGITNAGVTDPSEEFIMQTDEVEENRDGRYDKEFKNVAFNLPSLKLMKGIGDGISNAMRGSRLQGMYQDRAVADGRSKASGYQDFKNDKMSMMTEKDKAFYDKYMNLADMAQDNQKAQEYRDTAETAWRNQQTTDRLSMVSGFEDYRPEKYESYDYPGRGRMEEIASNLGYDVFNPLPGSGRSDASGQDAIASQMNYPGAMESGISYTDPDLVNDDILYGEPGNMGTGSIDVGRPPSQVQPGMNFMEPFDPYEGIYESPLTDDLYGEELVQVSPNPRLMNKAQYMLPRDTAAIESMGGGMNALPLLGFEEEELIQDPRGRLRLYGN